MRAYKPAIFQRLRDKHSVRFGVKYLYSAPSVSSRTSAFLAKSRTMETENFQNFHSSEAKTKDHNLELVKPIFEGGLYSNPWKTWEEKGLLEVMKLVGSITKK